MALRDCPVCGTAVKLENLERHVANVHPRYETPLSLSNEDRQSLREAARTARPAFHVRRSTVAVALVLLVIIVGVVVAAPYISRLNHGSGGPMHWHPQLRVTIDGRAVTIPANIGVDFSLWVDHSLDAFGMSGMAPLHTHDTTGTIHVESNVARDYTLAELFRIWGNSFDSQELLGHPAQPGHAVSMVVDGRTIGLTDSLVLKDGMQIALVCGPA